MQRLVNIAYWVDKSYEISGHAQCLGPSPLALGAAGLMMWCWAYSTSIVSVVIGWMMMLPAVVAQKIRGKEPQCVFAAAMPVCGIWFLAMMNKDWMIRQVTCRKNCIGKMTCLEKRCASRTHNVV